jgi:hypothetical protein
VVVHPGEEWCVMVGTVEQRVAALEARLAVIEQRGREVERTVGIRFEEPVMSILENDVLLAAGAEAVEVAGSDTIEGALASVLAEGVDDAEGVEAPGQLVVDDVGPVDWPALVGAESGSQVGADGGDTVLGAEVGPEPAGDTQPGGEG